MLLNVRGGNNRHNLTLIIVFPQMGYFFRVQVCYLREIYLQRLVETPEGDWKEQETAAATQLELEIETLPRLTTAIARLALQTKFSIGLLFCFILVSFPLVAKFIIRQYH